MKEKVRFEMVLDKQMSKDLDTLASLSKTGLSKTHLIRIAVAEYLERELGQRKNLS